MTSASLPLSRDDMRLIAEVGFIGTQSGQPSAARALFESLLVLRPESTLPFVGLAMAELAADRPLEAARRLREEGLKQHPGDPELLSFLGLALQTAGQNAEAQRILADVIERTTADDAPHRMAAKLLNTSPSDPHPASLMPRWSEHAPRA